MGRGLAQGLLALVLLLSLVLAGCLGGPSEEDLDTDTLPSEYDTPQHADGPTETDPALLEGDPPVDPGVDFNATTENTTQDAAQNETQEDGDNASQEVEPYTGPPQAELFLQNHTGEPTTDLMGMAPYTAEFHLDAKIFDGAVPYWSLRLSGSNQPLAEGNSLPATVDHTIVAPGEYTAILFVSDGGGRDEKRVQIDVLRPPPPPPLLFNGTVTGIWTGDGYAGETTSHTFDLDVPVQKINATLDPGMTALDLDYELVAPDGTSVERRVDFFPSEEDPIVVTDPEFTHQLGTWTLYVMPALSVVGDYELEVTFE